MKNLRYRHFLALPLIPLIALCFATTSNATLFNITLTNLSDNVLTPAPFITHNNSFDLFTNIVGASDAVEMLAEGGDVSGVTGMALTAQSSGSVLDYEVAGAAPLGTGASASVMIEADMAHPLLSFMSMLAISNDAFIGGAYGDGDGAISLFSSGMVAGGSYTLYGFNVWDSGTEFNDQLPTTIAAGGEGFNPVRDDPANYVHPHSGISGNGSWAYGDPIARIDVQPVPEPATMLLFGAGFALLIGARIRKKAI